MEIDFGNTKKIEKQEPEQGGEQLAEQVYRLSTPKGLPSDNQHTAVDELESAAEFVIDVPMSALMSTADWGKDALLYGIEKGADAIGYATDNEKISNFDPYTYEQKTKSFKLTGKEMADFWVGEDNKYKEREGFIDTVGDIVNLVAGGAGVAKAMTKGSKFYSLVSKAGVPGKWASTMFTDKQAVTNAYRELASTVNQLAKTGTNPTSIKSVTSATGKLAKEAAKQGAKETLAVEGATWASHYKHDELYPEGQTLLQQASLYVALPAALGIGVPTLAAAQKARAVFAKGADKAGLELNTLLNNELVKKGLSPEFIETQKKQFSNQLTNYGLAGNKASDIAVETSYNIKALEILKEDAMKKASSIAGVNQGEIASYYDDLILAAKKRHNTSLDELVYKSANSDSKAFIKESVMNAESNWSNIMQGTSKLEMAPNNQKALDAITNDIANKYAIAKKKASSNNPKLKPENKIKRMEKLKELESTGVQLIDKDGKVYAAHDFHMRWSDNPDNLLTIKDKQLPVMTNGESSTSYTVKVFDETFSDGDSFTLTSKPTGEILINRNGGDKVLSYTDTAAYDPSWQLLGKQLNWMLKESVDMKNPGARIRNFEKLMRKYPEGIPISLANANPLQLAYLSNLSGAIGDSNITRLFKFNPDALKQAKARTASRLGLEESEVKLSQVFASEQVDAARTTMKLRQQELVKKSSTWNFPKFTEDSLMEELTGLSLTQTEGSLANKKGVLDFINSDWANYKKYATDNSLNNLFRKPEKYVLQHTNELNGLTDIINNDLMDRLVATKQHRINTLLNSKDTLVGKIANKIASMPHFSNGWLQTPVGIGYDVDALGKYGRLLMTQEARTEGNVILNASQAFANEMKLYTDKVITDAIAPLTEKARPIIANADMIDELGKLRYQSQSGWYMADLEPVLMDNGKYGFKLDPEKFARNSEIAERQSAIGNETANNWLNNKTSIMSEDGITETETYWLPDPFTGEPLSVSKEVADFALENHNLNKRVWQGNQDINSSIGRQGSAFRNYWFAPKDLSKLEVRIIGHQDGNRFIPDMYVTGNTAAQAEKAAQLEMEISKFSKDKNYSIKTPQDIGLEKEFIREDINANGFRWVDYSDTWRQQSSKLTGGIRKSLGNIVETGEPMVRGMLESINHNLQIQAKRTRSAMFSDEINTALSMLGNKAKGVKGYTELNDYIANLQGNLFKPQDARSSVYKAFDKLIELGAQAIDDWRNLSKYDRMITEAEIANGKLRSSSRIFESGDEVKRLYNFRGEIIDNANEAMRKLGVTKPVYPKEVIGAMNKVATWGLLMLGNFGYALMNIVSLGAVMPMMRRSLARRAGEDGRTLQARLGAYGQVVKNGKDFAIDITGGAMETLNYYMHNVNEFKSLMNDFTDSGILSTKASLLGEAFIDPVGSISGKAGRKFAKWLSSIGMKSEEVSRIIPLAEGYRMGIKSGLSHAESISFARKFSDTIVGSYVSSNKPALLQDALGSLFGLFYTYNHNVIQNYMKAALAGDKATIATGLAMQSFMFGPTSIPGFDQIADAFIPLESGRDLYSAYRQGGLSDKEARAMIYGLPSALTGLDFSSKGNINAVAIPGLATPPVVSLGGNLIDGVSDTVEAISNNTNTNARTLWEIWQNYLPVTAARSGLNVALGYKTDRKGRLVADSKSVGEGLWWASNILSMRTLDETMNRRAMQRYNNYLADQSNKKSWIVRNASSGLRAGREPNEVFHDMAVDYMAAGGDPKKLGQIAKNATVKAYVPTISQKAKQASNKKWQTPSDRYMARTLRFLSLVNSSNDATSENGNPSY